MTGQIAVIRIDQDDVVRFYNLRIIGPEGSEMASVGSTCSR